MANEGFLSKIDGKRSLIQIVRFAFVGLANTVTALLLVWMFHALLDLEIWIASGSAYAVSTVQSYFLNEKWTFADVAKRTAVPQFFAFIAVNVVCGTIFSLLNEYIERSLDLIISTTVAIAVTFPLSFVLNRFFVFVDESR